MLDPVSKDEAGDNVAVARFLRTCPGLSKAITGDLLGQNSGRCLRVLDAFCHMFDFSGARRRTATAPQPCAGHACATECCRGPFTLCLPRRSALQGDTSLSVVAIQ